MIDRQSNNICHDDYTSENHLAPKFIDDIIQELQAFYNLVHTYLTENSILCNVSFLQRKKLRFGDGGRDKN